MLLLEGELALLCVWHRGGGGRERTRVAFALRIRDHLGRGQIGAFALGDHVRITAGIFGPPAVALGGDHARHNAVEEVAVVADQQDGAGIVVQQLLQQIQRFEVEIVGRLVEHQDVGWLGQHAGEQQSRTLAAR